MLGPAVAFNIFSQLRLPLTYFRSDAVSPCSDTPGPQSDWLKQAHGHRSLMRPVVRRVPCFIQACMVYLAV